MPMPNPNEISWLKRKLDILREILHLQTIVQKLTMEKMVRETATRHGVDVEMLVAVIKAESGMNPNAVTRNKNGTTDFGLCQFNDYWYRDLITPSVALHDPQAAVDLMCTMWRQGRQSDWIAYRNKSYLKFMPTR